MAVIKAVSSKAGIGQALDYVTKEEKTEDKLVSGLHCEPDTVKDEMQATKELCGVPDKPCCIGVLCRAYKGGNPYQSSFTADTGTYRVCADKVVCKRVQEVKGILLN